MTRSKLVQDLAVVIVLLAVFNGLASFFSWYTLAWWFDMPMHFFGGVSVFYISAILWLPARKWVRDGRYIFESVITAVFLGVLWEALELYLHVHYGSPDFILLDSISDVFFDLAGALVAAYLLVSQLSKEQVSSSVVR